MTAPAASRQSVTVRSRLYSSGYWRGLRLAAGAAARGMSGPSSTSSHQLLEDAPALFVVVELVVALAGRRQQDDVTRTRRGAGAFDGGHQVAALDPGLDLRPDRRPVRADQVDAGTARGRLAQRPEVLPLAATAEHEEHRLLEAGERAERRVHVGRLGVVDVQHAVHRGDLLEAMLDAGEHAQRGAHGVGIDAAGERDRRRGRGIRAVVRAAQPDLVVGDQRPLVPPQLTRPVVQLAAWPEAHPPRT